MLACKKYLSLFLMLFVFAVSGFNHKAMADTHIYRGRYTNTSDILTTWDGKHLYSGRYTNTSGILLTANGIVPKKNELSNIYKRRSGDSGPSQFVVSLLVRTGSGYRDRCLMVHGDHDRRSRVRHAV